MPSKRYNAAVWIVGSLMVAAFAYYFITVLLFAGATSFKRKIKLTTQEKEMVKDFESECKCEVRLQHNYHLINNDEGSHFNSSDSTLNILFRNDLNKTMLPCNYSDIVLIAHAADVADRMMKTISYRNYYVYLNVIYSSFRKNDARSAHCYKTARFRLTEQQNIKFISIK